MHRRRAAEAERRHYVIDPSTSAAWSRRGSRLLLGGAMIVWFAGSIAIAYWLGEPYLRHHRNDLDPVESRLLAEALQRNEADRPAADVTPRIDPDTIRIQAMEQRIADAVLRIDEIRSNAVPEAIDERLRIELEDLRTQVATSHREINSLRDQMMAMKDISSVGLPTSDGISPASIQAIENNDTAVASLANDRSSHSLTTNPWAIGAVGLSLLANVVVLILLISRRNVRATLSKSDQDLLAAVLWSEHDKVGSVNGEGHSAPIEIGDTSSGHSMDDTAQVDAVAEQMIDEMRKASVAGVECQASDSDLELPSLILVDEEVDYLTMRAGKIDVVAENRLGLDFAVRITDRERAGLAERRTGDSGARNVA